MRKIKGYKFIDCQYFEDDEEENSSKEFGCWSGILSFYEDDFFMGVVKNLNRPDAPELVVGNLLPNKAISLTKFDYLSKSITPELYDSADQDSSGKLYSGNYVIMHDVDDLNTGYSYITLSDLEPSKDEQARIGEDLSEAVQEFSKCDQDFVKRLFNSIIHERPEDTLERLNFTYGLYSCENPELADACIVQFMLNSFLGADGGLTDLANILANLPKAEDSKTQNMENYDLGGILSSLGIVLDDDDTDMTDEEIERFAEVLTKSSDHEKQDTLDVKNSDLPDADANAKTKFEE